MALYISFSLVNVNNNILILLIAILVNTYIMIRYSVLNDTCKKLLFYDQRVCTVIMGDNLQNYLVHMHDKSEF